LRVPIAMRAFYERWLWIMKLFSVQESRLSPRAATEECLWARSYPKRETPPWSDGASSNMRNS